MIVYLTSIPSYIEGMVKTLFNDLSLIFYCIIMSGSRNHFHYLSYVLSHNENSARSDVATRTIHNHVLSSFLNVQ